MVRQAEISASWKGPSDGKIEERKPRVAPAWLPKKRARGSRTCPSMRRSMSLAAAARERQLEELLEAARAALTARAAAEFAGRVQPRVFIARDFNRL